MKCHVYNQKFNTNCNVKSCRYWIQKKDSKNCCLVASKQNEKLTLEDIGKFFNVTRMRICQIEKVALKKIKDKIIKSF